MKIFKAIVLSIGLVSITVPTYAEDVPNLSDGYSKCITGVIVSEFCLGWTEGGDEAFRQESKAQMTQKELMDCLRYTARNKLDSTSKYSEILTTGVRYMYRSEFDGMVERYGTYGWCNKEELGIQDQ